MPRPNRRLGARRNVEETALQWNIPDGGWRSRLRKETAQVGLLQDVSVTGAGVVAPANPSITRGSTVRVAFGWVEGDVRVKRVEPHPDGQRSIYGVEFDRTDTPLAKAIHAAFLDKNLEPY